MVINPSTPDKVGLSTASSICDTWLPWVRTATFQNNSCRFIYCLFRIRL